MDEDDDANNSSDVKASVESEKEVKIKPISSLTFFGDLVKGAESDKENNSEDSNQSIPDSSGQVNISSVMPPNGEINAEKNRVHNNSSDTSHKHMPLKKRPEKKQLCTLNSLLEGSPENEQSFFEQINAEKEQPTQHTSCLYSVKSSTQENRLRLEESVTVGPPSQKSSPNITTTAKATEFYPSYHFPSDMLSKFIAYHCSNSSYKPQTKKRAGLKTKEATVIIAQFEAERKKNLLEEAQKNGNVSEVLTNTSLQSESSLLMEQMAIRRCRRIRESRKPVKSQNRLPKMYADRLSYKQNRETPYSVVYQTPSSVSQLQRITPGSPVKDKLNMYRYRQNLPSFEKIPKTNVNEVTSSQSPTRLRSNSVLRFSPTKPINFVVQSNEAEVKRKYVDAPAAHSGTNRYHTYEEKNVRHLESFYPEQQALNLSTKDYSNATSHYKTQFHPYSDPSSLKGPASNQRRDAVTSTVIRPQPIRHVNMTQVPNGEIIQRLSGQKFSAHHHAIRDDIGRSIGSSLIDAIVERELSIQSVIRNTFDIMNDKEINYSPENSREKF